MPYLRYQFRLKDCVDFLYQTLNDWYSNPMAKPSEMEFQLCQVRTLVADEFLLYIYQGNMPMFEDPLLADLECYHPTVEHVQYLRTQLHMRMQEKLAMAGGIRHDVFYNINWISPDDVELELIPENGCLPYHTSLTI